MPVLVASRGMRSKELEDAPQGHTAGWWQRGPASSRLLFAFSVQESRLWPSGVLPSWKPDSGCSDTTREEGPSRLRTHPRGGLSYVSPALKSSQPPGRPCDGGRGQPPL